jgi:aminoglycoside phosphotransferase family enzyme
MSNTRADKKAGHLSELTHVEARAAEIRSNRQSRHDKEEANAEVEQELGEVVPRLHRTCITKHTQKAFEDAQALFDGTEAQGATEREREAHGDSRGQDTSAPSMPDTQWRSKRSRQAG